MVYPSLNEVPTYTDIKYIIRIIKRVQMGDICSFLQNNENRINKIEYCF